MNRQEDHSEVFNRLHSAKPAEPKQTNQDLIEMGCYNDDLLEEDEPIPEPKPKPQVKKPAKVKIIKKSASRQKFE